MDSPNPSQEEIALDEWQLKLEAKLRELHACQAGQQLESCMLCPQLFNCELRESYVHAVYASMNKGAGGGFEF